MARTPGDRRGAASAAPSSTSSRTRPNANASPSTPIRTRPTANTTSSTRSISKPTWRERDEHETTTAVECRHCHEPRQARDFEKRDVSGGLLKVYQWCATCREVQRERNKEQFQRRKHGLAKLRDRKPRKDGPAGSAAREIVEEPKGDDAAAGNAAPRTRGRPKGSKNKGPRKDKGVPRKSATPHEKAGQAETSPDREKIEHPINAPSRKPSARLRLTRKQASILAGSIDENLVVPSETGEDTSSIGRGRTRRGIVRKTYIDEYSPGNELEPNDPPYRPSGVSTRTKSAGAVAGLIESSPGNELELNDAPKRTSGVSTRTKNAGAVPRLIESSPGNEFEPNDAPNQTSGMSTRTKSACAAPVNASEHTSKSDLIESSPGNELGPNDAPKRTSGVSTRTKRADAIPINASTDASKSGLITIESSPGNELQSNDEPNRPSSVSTRTKGADAMPVDASAHKLKSGSVGHQARPASQRLSARNDGKTAAKILDPPIEKAVPRLSGQNRAARWRSSFHGEASSAGSSIETSPAPGYLRSSGSALVASAASHEPPCPKDLLAERNSRNAPPRDLVVPSTTPQRAAHIPSSPSSTLTMPATPSKPAPTRPTDTSATRVPAPNPGVIPSYPISRGPNGIPFNGFTGLGSAFELPPGAARFRRTSTPTKTVVDNREPQMTDGSSRSPAPPAQTAGLSGASVSTIANSPAPAMVGKQRWSSFSIREKPLSGTKRKIPETPEAVDGAGVDAPDKTPPSVERVRSSEMYDSAPELRMCPRCKREKPPSSFRSSYKVKNNGRCEECRAINAENARKRRKDIKDSKKGKESALGKKGPEGRGHVDSPDGGVSTKETETAEPCTSMPESDLAATSDSAMSLDSGSELGGAPYLGVGSVTGPSGPTAAIPENTLVFSTVDTPSASTEDAAKLYYHDRLHFNWQKKMYRQRGLSEDTLLDKPLYSPDTQETMSSVLNHPLIDGTEYNILLFHRLFVEHTPDMKAAVLTGAYWTEFLTWLTSAKTDREMEYVKQDAQDLAAKEGLSADWAIGSKDAEITHDMKIRTVESGSTLRSPKAHRSASINAPDNFSGQREVKIAPSPVVIVIDDSPPPSPTTDTDHLNSAEQSAGEAYPTVHTPEPGPAQPQLSNVRRAAGSSGLPITCADFDAVLKARLESPGPIQQTPVAKMQTHSNSANYAGTKEPVLPPSGMKETIATADPVMPALRPEPTTAWSSQASGPPVHAPQPQSQIPVTPAKLSQPTVTTPVSPNTFYAKPGNESEGLSGRDREAISASLHATKSSSPMPATVRYAPEATKFALDPSGKRKRAESPAAMNNSPAKVQAASPVGQSGTPIRHPLPPRPPPSVHDTSPSAATAQSPPMPSFGLPPAKDSVEETRASATPPTDARRLSTILKIARDSAGQEVLVEDEGSSSGEEPMDLASDDETSGEEPMDIDSDDETPTPPILTHRPYSVKDVSACYSGPVRTTLAAGKPAPLWTPDAVDGDDHLCSAPVRPAQKEHTVTDFSVTAAAASPANDCYSGTAQTAPAANKPAPLGIPDAVDGDDDLYSVPVRPAPKEYSAADPSAVSAVAVPAKFIEVEVQAAPTPTLTVPAQPVEATSAPAAMKPIPPEDPAETAAPPSARAPTTEPMPTAPIAAPKPVMQHAPEDLPQPSPNAPPPSSEEETTVPLRTSPTPPAAHAAAKEPRAARKSTPSPQDAEREVTATPSPSPSPAPAAQEQMIHGIPRSVLQSMAKFWAPYLV